MENYKVIIFEQLNANFVMLKESAVNKYIKQIYKFDFRQSHIILLMKKDI